MDYYLTELIDLDVLQNMQDTISDLAGMAVIITDSTGKAVTNGSNFTEFCMQNIRKSELGTQKCEECDRYGAEKTLRTGDIEIYSCHAGLCDFSAPIMCRGEQIGCIIGGQVITEQPQKDKVAAVAKDLGIDGAKLWDAAKKVPVKSEKDIEFVAYNLRRIEKILMEIAEGKLELLEAQEEVKRAADMKSDFLANMSHEIRTPMNAVIGMAEMILREDISLAARDYASQIKSSGRSLLAIINDILDFSKIESGKLDIECTEYEPLSGINDIINILSTRMGEKPVELIFSGNPNIPSRLYGDVYRIRQIIINIANNAIKFTQSGKVIIDVDYEQVDDENVIIKFEVEDTGIGIKKEDLTKLFKSFQQIDSKRNRNVEGTGLGLAISENLLKLMGGNISVESEYEKGSIFRFEIPQKVINWEPSLAVDNPDKVAALGVFRNRNLARYFYKDLKSLNVYSMAAVSTGHIEDALNAHAENICDKDVYLFFEQTTHDDRIIDFLKANSHIKGVIFAGYNGDFKTELDNLRVFKRPMSTFSIARALNNEDIHSESSLSNAFQIDFTAPSANILIVDDNAINLTVAEGLLEPLRMKVYSANSGQRAIEMMSDRKFDLIFMDHMMPGMDGVETTRVIRRLYPEYSDVPIIALTANAVGGMKETFLEEGMNDFVAKPIEVSTIISKVRQWLPVDKIVRSASKTTVNKEENTSPEHIVIGDLDTDMSRKLTGNDKLFWTILKEYYRTIDVKAESIQKHWQNKDWPAYTIDVHALKSSSKQIGAVELSDMAADLERAGNSRDTAMIDLCTSVLLDKYKSYKGILEPFCTESTDVQEKPEIQLNMIMSFLDEMYEAVDNLDMREMTAVIEKMNSYSYPENEKLIFEALKAAVDDIDVDKCVEIIDEWRTLF